MKKLKLQSLIVLLLMALILPLSGMAQTRTIKGTVYDEDGKPLSDVKVRIRGASKVAVVTDANGFYTLEVDEFTSEILYFDKEDYDRREIDVKGEDVLNVKLYSDVRYNAYGAKVDREPATVEFRNGILNFETADQNFKLWFDNRVYVDFAYFPTKDVYNPIGNGVNIRRARFAMKTRVHKNWYGEIDLDFAGSAIEMKDMIVGYYFMKDGKDYAHIRVGHYKENFSMETTTTSRYVTFIERSLVSKMAPSRHIGASYTQWGKKWLFIGGLYFQAQGENEEVIWSQDKNKAAGLDEGYSATFRGVVTPLNDNEKVLHIGAAYSYRTPKTSAEVYKGYRYSTRSFTSINRKKYLDTDDIANVETQQLYGIELAGAYKNFFFQSEYIGTQLNGTELNKEVGVEKGYIDGAYAQIGWLIFGGKYNYNTKEGEFTQITRGKDWGDLELAFRFDYVNANDFDAKIYGGAANGYSVGLNYHVNSNVKLMLNYNYVDHDRYANGKGKLYIGHDVNGELTKDFTQAVEAKGDGGDDYGIIQARVEIDF